MKAVVFTIEKNGEYQVKLLKLNQEGRILRCDVLMIFDSFIKAKQFETDYLKDKADRFKVIKERWEKRIEGGKELCII